MIRRRLSADSGMSLVELAMTLLITSLMSITLITWISSASKAAGLHREDDQAVQDLRVAKEHITRDLRVARSVLVAEPSQVSVWVDADEDEYQDPGEAVTWRIENGSLTKGTDLTAPHIEASNLDVYQSRFTYDASPAAAVTQIEVTLVASVTARTGEPSQRTLTVGVSVRNAG